MDFDRKSSSHAFLRYCAIASFGSFDQLAMYVIFWGNIKWRQGIKNSLLDENDIPKLSPESSLSILNVAEKNN